MTTTSTNPTSVSHDPARAGAPLRVRFVQDPGLTSSSATTQDGAVRCWVVGTLVEPLRDGATTRDVVAGDPAEFLLDQYVHRGVTALREADGFFSAAVCDARTSALHLTVDFCGSVAMYYAQIEGEWIISSNFRCLREALPGRMQWDVDALRDFLWTNFCLLDNTLDRRVKNVPAASLVTCRDNSATVEMHNLPESFECLPDDEDTHERMAQSILEVVRRWSVGFERPALRLSGGCDSRLVLAALTTLGRQVGCYMHNAQETVDSLLAESAARFCGQPFRRETVGRQIEANFARYANRLYQHTGGCLELWAVNGMALHDLVPEHHDVCYTGIGTALTIKYATGIGEQSMTPDEFARVLTGFYEDPDVSLALFPEEFRGRLSDNITRRIAKLAETFPPGLESHQWADLHVNAQRGGRWYSNGLRLGHDRLPIVCPLLSRDFSLLGLRLPWSIKRKKRFGELFARRTRPELAYLPTTNRWPDRPLRVKLLARLPRSLSPYAYDRGWWWPRRRNVSLVAKPLDRYVHSAIGPHRDALLAFIDGELGLPLDRATVRTVFQQFADGDFSQFRWVGSLTPLLMADGFVFDERSTP